MINSGSRRGKDKYYLPYLRECLENIGKNFSEFADGSSSIDKSPSRRTWADATNASKGVTKTMANKMSIRTSQIFEKWNEDLPEKVACVVMIDTSKHEGL